LLRPFNLSLAVAGIVAVTSPAAASDSTALFKCPRIDAGEIEGNFLKSHVHQGANGWFLREGSDLQEFFELGDVDLTYMGRFAAALRAKGVKLVYLPVPPKAIIQPDRVGSALKPEDYSADVAHADFETALAEWRRQGVVAVDVLNAPLKLGANDDFFFGRDQHWKPAGARIAAAAVKAALSDDPDYQGLDKKTYQTKDLGQTQPLASAMLTALQRMCTDTLPQEKSEVYETTAGQATANDLLGASDTTPVALIGTSFSDLEAFNFVGFLEEALGLEVANYAISGGGAFTSMESYVNSDALEKAPPKFLVWENPGYDRLDGEGISEFRQMIPAVYGYCDGGQRLAETKIHIEAKGSAVVPLAAGEPVQGHRYYLAMRAGDAGVRSMTLTIDHVDGDGEFFAVTRSDRAKASDRFFVEFSDDIPAAVKSVTISGQPDRPVDFAVQLCKAPKEK
jgi:alginate biosynthesis protein AlgX